MTRDVNTRLTHRGVLFAVKRHGLRGPAGFWWAIYPRSAPADGADRGATDGFRAFSRAYAEAQGAIDRWLVASPGDEL